MSENINKTNTIQLNLPLKTDSMVLHKKPTKKRKNSRINKLDPEDRAFHDWYRFVLSYPPHLVRDYIHNFGLKAEQTVLDPFCGTGTTLVEAKLQGLKAVGMEANLFPRFASSVKVDWHVDSNLLRTRAAEIAKDVAGVLKTQGIDDDDPEEKHKLGMDLRRLKPEAEKLLLANSISPLPLHKTLVLIDHLYEHKHMTYYRHALLALANALVFKISNLHFGPEVGVRNPKCNAPVLSSWMHEVNKMADDLSDKAVLSTPAACIHTADSRNISDIIAPSSIDAVITSPPYPNEKDYTRTTRLESVLLGFIKDKAELRALKKTLVRSNTRGVYKDDDDDDWIAEQPEIHRIAEAIEKRRIDLGKNSGFERMYSRVAKLYFGGMARHLSDLRTVLRPGARLAYVVGDQASYLRVMIRTGQLLSEIAESLGYEPVRIDLFRTRLATATREQLREEVVILRWPG